MQIIRVPASRKMAKVTIISAHHGGTGVRAVMELTSAMQSTSQQGEFASAEEAEKKGIAWAEAQGADLLVIDGG